MGAAKNHKKTIRSLFEEYPPVKRIKRNPFGTGTYLLSVCRKPNSRQPRLVARLTSHDTAHPSPSTLRRSCHGSRVTTHFGIRTSCFCDIRVTTDEPGS